MTSSNAVYLPILALLMLVFVASPKAVAQTFGEKSVGTTGCTYAGSSADFDTLAQCTSTTGTGGSMQKAPVFAGAVTSPPYASTTCDSNKAGMIQQTGTAMQFCNGTSWVNMGASSNTPDAFSFTDQTDVDIESTITSNEVTLSGFTGALAAACTGCTAVARNGTWGGTSLATFISGDTIAIRQTSSSSGSTSTTATVTVGNTTSATWTVTTIDPCALPSPAIGTVCGDGTVYAGLTPDGSVKMFVTRCDQGQTWDGSSCTGTRTTYKFDTVGVCATGVTNQNTGRSNTTTLAGLSNTCSPYPAAVACENLSLHGQTDWYLPAYQELNVIRTNYSSIGNFIASNFWSSTEYNAMAGAAYYCPMGSSCSTATMTTSMYVRCARH